MGFFGRLFGSKKQDKGAPLRNRRRWSLITRSSNQLSSNSSKRRSYPPPPAGASAEEENGLDVDKHAIAVVAEAALSAADAATEVVRLTSGKGERSGGNSSVFKVGGSKRQWAVECVAVVKIQSAFRGYLARRALRALKALVKLQALVRGHIVRKQTADMLRRMQTLVRLQAQARARASRFSHSSASFHSSTSLLFPSSSPRSLHTRCVSNAELIAIDQYRGSSKRLDWQAEEDEDESKILQVDTWKPHYHPISLRSERNNEFLRKKQQSLLVPRSIENGPEVGSSGSRRRTPFTPMTRSENSWACNDNYYSGHHTNYMPNNESYVRSQSAPKQRLNVSNETSGYKRSVHGDHYYYTTATEQSLDVGMGGYYGGVSDRLSRNQSEKTRMHSSFLI